MMFFFLNLYVEIKVLPLSFKEFISFNTFSAAMTNEEKFALYLKYGGMPALTEYDFDNESAIFGVLEGIFTTVVMEDIIKQASVREPVTLDKIINFLADNIGNSVSTNNIKNRSTEKKLRFPTSNWCLDLT